MQANIYNTAECEMAACANPQHKQEHYKRIDDITQCNLPVQSCARTCAHVLEAPDGSDPNH